MLPVVRVPHADYMARLHWRLRARLPMWVVYRPVTRESIPAGGWRGCMSPCRNTPHPVRHDLLAWTSWRSPLPPALTWMERNPQDVPEIEEVWLHSGQVDE